MFYTAVLLVATAAQAVLGTPIQSRTSYAVKEKHYVPKKWAQLGRAPKEAVLYLQIGVKQGQFAELERQLYEVSDPEHARYGQHLTHEEVNELIKPTDEALVLLHEWLAANSIQIASYSPAKDWINVYVNVESAERLLDTEYYVYKHEADGIERIRTTEWSLPKHLHEHVDAIQPTTSFLRAIKQADFHDLAPRQSTSNPIPWPPSGLKIVPDGPLGKVCSLNGTTPACFAELYGTKGYEQKAIGKISIGFANFLNNTPVRPETKTFLEKYKPEAVAGAADFLSIEIANGPAAQDFPTTAEQAANLLNRESNLDVQTIIGQTWPMPVISYSTGGFAPGIGDATSGGADPGNEPYLAWVTYVLGEKNHPQVLSTSYDDDEQSVPVDYAKRVCNGFAQLGARGVSVLFCSGDGGVGHGDASVCFSNDGKNRPKFIPFFPATCPYVTTVGATESFEPEIAALRPDNSLGPDDVAHSFWASGAGFSDYFPRPSYQDSVVPAYVKGLNGKYAGLYNSSGRAYPDISAQGFYFDIVWNSTFKVASGTSASTPLMASIIALVNDALISSGRPVLGFLNPWLYSKGYRGFTDIIHGTSAGCNTTGFPVTKGWDAVTGFGTPNFPELVKLAKEGHYKKH